MFWKMGNRLYVRQTICLCRGLEDPIKVVGGLIGLYHWLQKAHADGVFQISHAIKNSEKWWALEPTTHNGAVRLEFP